jgi:hypothetical protein
MRLHNKDDSELKFLPISVKIQAPNLEFLPMSVKIQVQNSTQKRAQAIK